MNTPFVLALLAASAPLVSAQTSPPAGTSGGSGGIAPLVPSALISSGGPNLVLNGDFEQHTGTGCQTNLSNAVFGNVVANARGFGVAEELDVLTGPACWGGGAHSGTTKVALHARSDGTADAFSLELATPLLTNASCTLTLWMQTETTFDPNPGTIAVGISPMPLVAGTDVAAFSSTQLDTWEGFSVTFTATVDAAYITFRAIGVSSWIHLDEVVMRAFTSTAYCRGDGSGAACPCGNQAPPGSGGCLSSLGTSGVLATQGMPSFTNDTLVLVGSGMPNSSALYFQGTSTLNGGLGAPFGDGLRCVGGTIVRLGTHSNVAGASSYPVAGDAPVSVRGACQPGDIRHYQVWYRNAAAFCTASTSNLTNAVEITWSG